VLSRVLCTVLAPLLLRHLQCTDKSRTASEAPRVHSALAQVAPCSKRRRPHPEAEQACACNTRGSKLPQGRRLRAE
jgi:hypothetical protein